MRWNNLNMEERKVEDSLSSMACGLGESSAGMWGEVVVGRSGSSTGDRDRRKGRM